jgi:DNA repair photolyase
MRTIYKPGGAALEYGDLALNIYTECNHGCTYCYARMTAKRFGKPWTGVVEPRKGIVEAVKRQLDRGYILHRHKARPDLGILAWTERIELQGKLIHLCFSCDPYPAEIDTTPTREIIKLIKDSGNHVQILTKGGNRAERDFDLLDSNDWFGVTMTGANSEHWNFGIEPTDTIPPHSERYKTLKTAKSKGINTWVSAEPVINPKEIKALIIGSKSVDLFRIGKLNYVPNDTDWSAFGHECERIALVHNQKIYIKDSLRKAMEVD